MSELRQRIIDTIRADGPIPVSLYMMMCLHDPAHGYYASRPGLGRDFTTAPEISQIFGEMIGLWCLLQWRLMGSPGRLQLIELGPGRGVMMADALRAGGRADAGFAQAAQPVLVESSAVLRREQAARLGAASPIFIDRLAEAPAGPFIVLANEFLDCMPVRQFIRDGDGFRERLVGVRDGGLGFGLGEATRLPAHVAERAGAALEICVALEAFMHDLASPILSGEGCALFIDYGPPDSRPGDTLRAFRDGRQTDPLDDPGASDLTADVDFGRLAALARSHGLSVVGPTPQGAFLDALGARERASALAAANPARAAEIMAGLRRLTHPAEMGERFQAIALMPPGAPPPPGLEGTAA